MDDVTEERIAGLEKLLRAEIASINRLFDRFEETVTARFAQVNEFRGSLDDLGKQMATRRELESAAAALAGAIEGARQERQHQVDDLRSGLSELRSRLDIGPVQLTQLQAEATAASARQGRVSIPVLFGGLAALAAFMTIVVITANWVASRNSSSSTPAVVCSASYNPAPCPR